MAFGDTLFSTKAYKLKLQAIKSSSEFENKWHDKKARLIALRIKITGGLIVFVISPFAYYGVPVVGVAYIIR